MSVNGRKHVLVVDDDRDLVKGLELYLSLEGFDVVCAYGGAGAIQEMSASQPSAVILDIRMPDIDGVDVCRYIRDDMGDQDTPLIILTAICDSETRRELFEAGANEYVTKPCDFGRLCSTVEQLTA